MSKRYKYLTFVLALALLSSLGIIGYRHFPYGYRTYYANLPIRFNSSSLPCTEIEIGSISHLVVIDLGSQFPLSLEEGFISSLKDKKAVGVASSSDIFGNKYKSPACILPIVKMGGLGMHDVCAKVTHAAMHGNVSVGKFLGPSIDLCKSVGSSLGYCYLVRKDRPPFVRDWFVMDFPHRSIVLTNSKSLLKKTDIDLKNFIQIPFSYEKDGIIVHVETDFGILRFLIDTGATACAVDKKLLSEEVALQPYNKYHTCRSERFAIGGQQYTAKEFCTFDFPEFVKCDGVLGMDFLRQYIVCLDCKDQVAYIESPKGDTKINLEYRRS